MTREKRWLAHADHGLAVISIVIPYFQRQPHVLRRALASVARQEGLSCKVRILVVDDASPSPATTEVDAVTMPDHMVVDLLHRSNGGPGAARNTGLDAIASTSYVAFLDSDDEWYPDHLARAFAALESGHDFYFANLQQLDQEVGAFERAGRMTLAHHRPLPATGVDLFAYTGDMFEQIAFGNVIGTSTVVFRHAACPRVRFKPAFRTAGEDYLFWMEATSLTQRIAFSSRIAARYGRGVNVYAGVQWGTLEHLHRTRDELSYRVHVLENFSLRDDQRRRLREQVEALQVQFAKSFAHAIVHDRRHALVERLSCVSLMPSAVARLPAMVLSHWFSSKPKS